MRSNAQIETLYERVGDKGLWLETILADELEFASTKKLLSKTSTRDEQKQKQEVKIFGCE